MEPPLRRPIRGLAWCICWCAVAGVAAEAPAAGSWPLPAAAALEEPSNPFAFPAFGGSHDAVGRRLLFGFSMPNVGGMVDSAVQWAEGAAHSVASAAGSVGGGLLALPQAAAIFSNASVYVDQGLQVARAAWDSITALAQQMLSIFTDFSPLKPIFADKNGLAQLFIPTNLQALVKVVRELTNTTSVLRVLSSALNKVSEMFSEFQGLFKGVLSKLGGGGPTGQRRLDGGYLDLLRGIDFKELLGKIQGYLGRLSKCVISLTDVQDVLGPLLMKLEGFGGNGRRLDVASIVGDQKRYSSAISKIVPTWKDLEGAGIEMCPKVLQVKETAASLKCRVTQFAQSAVLPTWASGMVPGLVDQCGSNPASNPTELAVATAGCPQQSQSSNVEDLLGQNANQLGWLIAIFGGLGLTGACGFAGVKALTKGGHGGEASETEGEDSADHEYPLKGHGRE